MRHKRDELNLPVIEDGYECVSFLKTNDVINAFNKLKSGKRDGTLGLCTAPHVSMLFSAMLIHDVASEDM